MALFRRGLPKDVIIHSDRASQYEPIMTWEEMRQALFEYIEVDYNRTRRHSAFGYLSPVNFDKICRLTKCPIYLVQISRDEVKNTVS